MSNISKHSTAILVFAHSSMEELRHKKINDGHCLFDALTNQALKIAKNSGLPYFHYSENHQIGNCFGDRFTNAISAIFEKGFEQVITIGNDTPQLTVSHIREAATQLHSKKLVLGPATDGGFYLMGLHKSQFNPTEFKKLAWQTSSLSNQVIKAIEKKNVAIYSLEYLVDIDNINDIKSILKYSLLPKDIYFVLLKILNAKTSENFDYSVIYTATTINNYHNKGSPLLQYS